MKTQIKITLDNGGGELDSKVVEVDLTRDDSNPVKRALMVMLQGIDLQPGDTVKVEKL